MKRSVIALLLSVLIVAGLAACTSETQTGGESENKTPVAAGTPSGSAGQNETPEQAPEQPKDVTIEEQVLVDESDIKITAKKLDTSDWYGPAITLLIENNSDKGLTVQARDSSVNGYMIETMMSVDVAAGKKANDSVTFSASDLETCGVTTLADFELSFHIFTTDGWDTYLDTNLVQIKTSAADTYEYTFDDSGDELYSGNGIRIISKGVSTDDSIFGPGLILYIENLSDQPITVQARDVSVNGFMIDTIMSEEVVAGKRSNAVLTFMSSSLEENEIEEIQDVELSFHIFNTDSWDTVADTEAITVNAG